MCFRKSPGKAVGAEILVGPGIGSGPGRVLRPHSMVVWALRPNLERLRQGTERMHGLRVWLKKRRN